MNAAFNNNLDSHHIIHKNSKVSMEPNRLENKKFFVNDIMKRRSTTYAALKSQYKIKYQLAFSARFEIQDKDDQVLDETEKEYNLIFNQNMKESEVDKIKVKFQWERQTHNEETKNSDWSFDIGNSKTIYFFKTTELNGLNYVKRPTRYSAISKIEKGYKFCFLWSILALIFFSQNTLKVYKKTEYFVEVNFDGLDFPNRYKRSDFYIFEKKNKLSIKYSFYQVE